MGKISAKQKNIRFQRLVNFDRAGWTMHTTWHFSRMVAGKKLDHWPNTNKTQYADKVKEGIDVLDYIQILERNNARS